MTKQHITDECGHLYFRRDGTVYFRAEYSNYQHNLSAGLMVNRAVTKQDLFQFVDVVHQYIDIPPAYPNGELVEDTLNISV